MDISGPWSDAAAELLLEPQSAAEGSGSQMGQSTLFTGSGGDLRSLTNFPDAATLGYLNDWDDIEMYAPFHFYNVLLTIVQTRSRSATEEPWLYVLIAKPSIFSWLYRNGISGGLVLATVPLSYTSIMLQTRDWTTLIPISHSGYPERRASKASLEYLMLIALEMAYRTPGPPQTVWADIL